MYSFTINEEGPGADIIVTRALLALSAIAALGYQTSSFFYLNILVAVLLLLGAIFIKLLMVRYAVSQLIVLTTAAVLLFIATHSISFALILFVYGYLVKFLFKSPRVIITEEGITIKRSFTSSDYNWTDLSNVVLKDNLLTLDFRNNKLIQVSIDEKGTVIDEAAFNLFCRRFLQ